jgi:hypothetical protein
MNYNLKNGTLFDIKNGNIVLPEAANQPLPKLANQLPCNSFVGPSQNLKVNN